MQKKIGIKIQIIILEKDFSFLKRRKNNKKKDKKKGNNKPTGLFKDAKNKKIDPINM